MRDREVFIDVIRSVENIEQEARATEREAYLHTSAAHHLQNFIDGIADSVNTPYFETGFHKLCGVFFNHPNTNKLRKIF